MEFWNQKDYKKQYGLSPKDLAKIIETQFIPSLERAIANELKIKGRKSTNSDIGLGTKKKTADKKTDEDEESSSIQKKKKEVTGNESEEELESEAEGDGDVAETSAKKKKTQQSTYDESESDDDEDIAEETASTISEQDEIEIEKATDNAKQIIVDAKFVSKYLFDKAGNWCEISLNFTADTQKLLMVSIVETVAWNVIIHRIPGIDRCFPQPNDNENDTSVTIFYR